MARPETRAEFADIAGEQGREVGVHDRGVAAADEADERRGLVGGDHLVEAGCARKCRGAPLVRRHDGTRA